MSILAREPVRAGIYSVTVAALALLVALGVIDDGQSASIAAGIGAALAVVTELARAHVSPVPSGAHVADEQEAS